MTIEKAKKLLDELNLDAIVIYNGVYPFISPNFLYFFQPKSGIFEGSTLLITKDEVVLYTSKLEESAAKENDLVKRGEIKVEVLDDRKKLFRKLKGFRRIGLEFENISASFYRRIENLGVLIVDVSEELNELRAIKEEWEIEKIKKAVHVSEKALKKLIEESDLRKMSESEIKAELEYLIAKQGCGLAFDTIVAFDGNAAIPHYTTKGVEKGAKKVILIDFGAKCDNYCADITRTFIIAKEDEIIKAYNAVLEAQIKAIETIKEGIEASHPDKIAREIIKSKGFNDYPHSLGHMLGILVHDGKIRLHHKVTEKLKAGMIFTVEPGIYIEEKFGIRIEDDIAVRKEKAEVLSSFPKELDDVMI